MDHKRPPCQADSGFRNPLFFRAVAAWLRGCGLSRPGLPGLAFFLMIPSIVFWPVDMLLIRDEADRLVLRAVMPLGRTFETQYFHSVQLSPVEDLYHVRDGLVREWQGRVQAQGVGLPCVALSHGRFYVDPPWTVFEGEVMTLPEFALRVGTTVIGRNQLRLGNGEWTPLYPIFPGERLYVGTARQTLCARGEMVTRGNLDLR